MTNNSGTRVHVYSYDKRMSLRAERGNLQLTEVNYPPELGYLATDTEFTYDAVGNLVTPDPDPGRLSVIDGSGGRMPGTVPR